VDTERHRARIITSFARSATNYRPSTPAGLHLRPRQTLNHIGVAVDNAPVPSDDTGGPATSVRAGRRGRSAFDRFGFGLLLLAVVTAVLAMPFAVASMAGSLKHPVAAVAFHLSVPAANQRSTTAVNLRLVGIDEPHQSVTMAVTGDRACAANCGGGEVLKLFSLRADPRGSDGAPPSQDVAVPASGEFDSSVTLPIEGSLGAYPFDHYQMLMGVGLADKTASGQVVPVPARSARDQLDVSFDEQLPRYDVATPRDLTGTYRFVGGQVALTSMVDLTRPLYLQALTVLIIVFIAIAGLYGVITREFKEVIGTVGVVVLGMWGVRTLLVGGYPPDSTAVDLILTFMILVLLMVVMVRGLLLMWRRTGNRLGTALARDRPALVGQTERTQESLDDIFSDIA
jgi:hypothetical protein